MAMAVFVACPWRTDERYDVMNTCQANRARTVLQRIRSPEASAQEKL
jgi:hypothetical protein